MGDSSGLSWVFFTSLLSHLLTLKAFKALKLSTLTAKALLIPIPQQCLLELSLLLLLPALLSLLCRVLLLGKHRVLIDCFSRLSSEAGDRDRNTSLRIRYLTDTLLPFYSTQFPQSPS